MARSDEASFASGSPFTIDGGLTAQTPIPPESAPRGCSASEEGDRERHRHRHGEPKEHSRHPSRVPGQRELQSGEPCLHLALELGQLPVEPIEAGVRPVDAGVCPVDAGVGFIEAGVRAVDASVGFVDAGVVSSMRTFVPSMRALVSSMRVLVSSMRAPCPDSEPAIASSSRPSLSLICP